MQIVLNRKLPKGQSHKNCVHLYLQKIVSTLELDNSQVLCLQIELNRFLSSQSNL